MNRPFLVVAVLCALAAGVNLWGVVADGHPVYAVCAMLFSFASGGVLVFARMIR